MLKPSDVEQKTFSTALRGYDLDEVDDFLDEIVATIRELNKQLDEAREGQATTAPAPVTQPTPAAEVDESAVGRALIAAQAAADRLLEEAESEAAKIVDGARSEADDLVAERDAHKAEAQAEIDKISARVTAVKTELAALADQVAVKLEEMEAVVEDQPEGDAAGRHASADLSESIEDSEDGSATSDQDEESDDLGNMLASVAADLGDDDGSPQSDTSELHSAEPYGEDSADFEGEDDEE